MIVADPSFGSGMSAAAFAGTVVSFASIGAGVGKIANGFSVKLIGGRNTASLYMMGIAAFSIMLSTTTNAYSYAIAGMEFCASIIWVACSDIFSNKYVENPKKFSKSITKLSLASTSGTLVAKTAGVGLLTILHWRNVARVSALFAILGACLMQFAEPGHFKSSKVTHTSAQEIKPSIKEGNFLQKIVSSYSRILRMRAVWLCILSHGICFAVRSSDKLLGAFYSEVANLPGEIHNVITKFLMKL